MSFSFMSNLSSRWAMPRTTAGVMTQVRFYSAISVTEAVTPPVFFGLLLLARASEANSVLQNAQRIPHIAPARTSLPMAMHRAVWTVGTTSLRMKIGWCDFGRGWSVLRGAPPQATRDAGVAPAHYNCSGEPVSAFVAPAGLSLDSAGFFRRGSRFGHDQH